MIIFKIKQLGCLLLVSAALAGMGGCGSTAGSDPISHEIYTGKYATEMAPAVLDRPDSLVVASYNIAFALEAEKAAEELLAEPGLQLVDILMLQEMDAEGTDHLARELGMDFVYGPSYVHPRHDRRFGTAVLSKWPITGHDYVVLPHSDPLTKNHRRVMSADIQVGDQLLRVVSVHLSTIVIPLEYRLDQVAAVIDSLGQVDHPIIIGGDFNTVSKVGVTKVRQAMRHAGLRQVRLPDGGTADSKMLDQIGQKVVLDHFFYQGLDSGRSGIASHFTASDHFPIWTVFTWPE